MYIYSDPLSGNLSVSLATVCTQRAGVLPAPVPTETAKGHVQNGSIFSLAEAGKVQRHTDTGITSESLHHGQTMNVKRKSK